MLDYEPPRKKHKSSHVEGMSTFTLDSNNTSPTTDEEVIQARIDKFLFTMSEDELARLSPERQAEWNHKREEMIKMLSKIPATNAT